MTKTMNDETFAELMQSVKEGAKILHGELPPASQFVHIGTDVKVIRDKIGLSQQEFANLLCISKRTLEAAMRLFLEDYYEQTHSDDVGALLGDIQLLEDGMTADPAVWDDWLACVDKV